MPIQVGTTGELVNAYIGEYVEGQYIYSYDFRNKSVALMQADGRNMFMNSSHAIFNSNGLSTNDSTYSVMAKIEGISTIMANANKVTLSETLATSQFEARLSLFNVATSSTRSGVTGPRASGTKNQIQTTIYGTNYTDSETLSSTITVTTVLDFTNKTRQTTSSDGYGKTGTLTDTGVSNIKNNSNGFYVSLAKGESTSGGFTRISVKIE